MSCSPSQLRDLLTLAGYGKTRIAESPSGYLRFIFKKAPHNLPTIVSLVIHGISNMHTDWVRALSPSASQLEPPRRRV